MKTVEHTLKWLKENINKLFIPAEHKGEFITYLGELEYAWAQFRGTSAGSLRAENSRLRDQLKKVEAERDQWRKQALEEDALNNIRNGKSKLK